jgi:transposase
VIQASQLGELRHAGLRVDGLRVESDRAVAAEQAARGSGRGPPSFERYLLGVANGRAVAGVAEGFWAAHDLLQSLCPMAQAGVWDRVLTAVTKAYDRDVQMIDSTSVRVHQHAANSKNHPDRCMGRSRGGLTTKIHALTDARGLPLELVLTPGQAGDCPVAEQLLGWLHLDTIVLADKADDADWLRRRIEAAGAAPNIPAMVHRRWKPCFSPVLYRA